MKCPERYEITQINMRGYVLSNDGIANGENHILIENQGFRECYKENCVAWGKEKQICRKVGQ